MTDPRSSQSRPPKGPPSPPNNFEARLSAARAREEQGRARRREDPTSSKAAMGYAFRVGIELAAGLVVGGGLGWLLDQWFGTMPLMLILFFFLGAGAGIRNVFRTAQEINKAQAANRDQGTRDQAVGKKDD